MSGCACVTLRLFARYGPQATLDMVKKEVMKYSDFEIDRLVRECAQRSPSFSKYALPREAFADAGKMQHLIKILPELRKQVRCPPLVAFGRTVRPFGDHRVLVLFMFAFAGASRASVFSVDKNSGHHPILRLHRLAW